MSVHDRSYVTTVRLCAESRGTYSILCYSNPPAYEPTTLVQMTRILMIHTAITASTVTVKSAHRRKWLPNYTTTGDSDGPR